MSVRNITDENILVKNKGMNPLVNFNFMLRVEMLFDLPCKSVRAITRENEYELIQEGGLNDYVHMRRKPISKPFTLEVERYVGVDYIDPLPNGAELALPVLLIVTRQPDHFFTPKAWTRTYAFTGCTVTKKVYGELDAEHPGLLTDTTTIAFREMILLDIPFGDAATHNAGEMGQYVKSVSEPESEQEKALKKEIKELETTQKVQETDRKKLETELKDLNRKKNDLEYKKKTADENYQEATNEVNRLATELTNPSLTPSQKAKLGAEYQLAVQKQTRAKTAKDTIDATYTSEMNQINTDISTKRGDYTTKTGEINDTKKQIEEKKNELAQHQENLNKILE